MISVYRAVGVKPCEACSAQTSRVVEFGGRSRGTRLCEKCSRALVDLLEPSRLELTALLEEAREVLGWHKATSSGSGVCCTCDEIAPRWPCPEASLAERIEAAWSSAGGSRIPIAPTAHGEAGSQAASNSEDA